MKDALRLGEITVKQHLASHKAQATELRTAELKEVEALTIKAGKLMLDCIVKAAKNSQDLSDMIRLINKFGRFKDSERWTITRLLSTQICVSGFEKNGNSDWFTLAYDGFKSGVSDSVSVSRRLITTIHGGMITANFTEGDLFMAHGDTDVRGIHLEAKVSDETIRAISKLKGALRDFDAADARVRELVTMEEDLPKTLESIEGNVLRDRLNGELGGRKAISAVENAIVAHLKGDVTALLLPTNNLIGR